MENLKNIPEELKQLPNWVVATLSVEHGKDGKPDKIPLIAGTKYGASSSNPKTWNIYENVYNYLTKHEGETIEHYDSKQKKVIPVIAAGAGFELGTEKEPSGYTAIDIDHCIKDGKIISVVDENTGEILLHDEEIEDIVYSFGTYTEISQSGTGLHLFARGIAKEPVHTKLEIYSWSRYIFMTGNVFDGLDIISDCQNGIDKLVEEYRSSKKSTRGLTASLLDLSSPLTDEEQLQILKIEADIRARKRLRKNATKVYRQYFEGACYFKKNSGEDDYSDNDMSLCNSLAYLTDNNGRLIDALFRRSALYRDKWDKRHYSNGQTYGQHTIQEAIAGNKEIKASRLAAAAKPDKLKLKRNATRQEKIEYYLAKYGTAEPVGDYTDQGQANIFRKFFSDRARYTAGGGWGVWDGERWRFSEGKDGSGRARELVELLNDIQKYEAGQRRKTCEAALREYQYQNDIAEGATVDNALKGDYDKIKKAKEAAEKYWNFAIKQRSNSKIKNCISAAEAGALSADITEFDSDPFLLNTKSCIMDLRTGKCYDHDPKYLCSKIASDKPLNYKPDNTMWADFLDKITGSNKELEEYLQLIVGSFAYGKVYGEYLYIAYGTGGNGKSTFFNVIRKVLGDYAGTITPDVFDRDSRGSFGAELADLRGKRFIVAAETAQDKPLNEAMVKRLCSTDNIRANPKYLAPFEFEPSHSMVLFTNHLPRVLGTDAGIWDRLILIPFQCRIRNTDSEVKNYADILYQECGVEITSWLLEGARRCYECNFKIKVPNIVKEAISEHKNQADSVAAFLDAYCEYGYGSTIQSSTLYNYYASYCNKKEREVVGPRVFSQAVERKYTKDKKNTGRVFLNLKCSYMPEFLS